MTRRKRQVVRFEKPHNLLSFAVKIKKLITNIECVSLVFILAVSIGTATAQTRVR